MVHDLPHVYHNWRYDVLSKCLPSVYDEERRLLYVAMTRAKDHLLFSAGASPSNFFENLPLEPAESVPDVQPADSGDTVQNHLQTTIPEREGPVGQSPHSLIDDHVFDSVTEGRGSAFGQQVHEFAERYAEGKSIEPSGEAEDDQRHVAAFLDALDGELRVEEPAYLPLTVDGEQVTISGVIDLLCVTPEAVEIVDYKTDRGRHAESEYRKQVSVYYHVVRKCFPDRDISACILYTEGGTQVPVDPLSEDELTALIRAEMATSNTAPAG